MTTPQLDHLDDEALSAAVDGAATAAEEAHLTSCSRCQARLASVAAAAQAVGAPVTPRPAGDVDRAIERALSAWSPAGEGGGSTAAVSGGQAAGSGPAPFTTAGTSSAGRAPTPLARRPARSSPWLVPAAGIAAAIVVVAGVVALARSQPRRRSTSTSAAAPVIATTQPRASATAAAVTGGDLGDQSDPSVLAHLAADALSGRDATSDHPSAEAPATAVAPSSAGSAGFAGASPAPQASPSKTAPAEACVAQARVVVGVTSGALRYTATLEWQGKTPAVIVVVAQPSGLAGAVMTAADCSLLAVLPF